MVAQSASNMLMAVNSARRRTARGASGGVRQDPITWLKEYTLGTGAVGPLSMDVRSARAAMGPQLLVGGGCATSPEITEL